MRQAGQQIVPPAQVKWLLPRRLTIDQDTLSGSDCLRVAMNACNCSSMP